MESVQTAGLILMGEYGLLIPWNKLFDVAVVLLVEVLINLDVILEVQELPPVIFRFVHF